RRDGALDTLLHRFEDLIGFLEPGARRRTHVQTELTRIHQWKKVLSCNHVHDEAAREKDAELDEHESPVEQCPVEHRPEFFANDFKAPIERAVDALEEIAVFRL